MTYDVLKDKLINKIEQELSDYKKDLINKKTPEEIINCSGETVLKEDIRDILDCSILGRNEIKVLLKTDNVIDKIYSKCVEKENTALDTLRDNVQDSIDNISKQYQRNKGKER